MSLTITLLAANEHSLHNPHVLRQLVSPSHNTMFQFHLTVFFWLSHCLLIQTPRLQHAVSFCTDAPAHPKAYLNRIAGKLEGLVRLLASQVPGEPERPGHRD
jgi:hypothetical protein